MPILYSGTADPLRMDKGVPYALYRAEALELMYTIGYSFGIHMYEIVQIPYHFILQKMA
jgi:hypothetical protein